MLFRMNQTAKSKKRRISSEPMIPRRRTSLIKTRHCERAVLCTFFQAYRQASLTVEAAVILPLFLFGMFTLISVIDICRIHVTEQTEIADEAKKLATYAYLAEEYMEDPYIDLYEVYPCKLQISLIPGYQINLALRGRVHAWTGRTEAECDADKHMTAEEMVYVTDHQAVYHTNSGCSYLELSVYAIGKEEVSAARNEAGGRYGACEKCCGASETGAYYITLSGDRYHASRSCSGLTRNVRMVRRSDVSDLSCCSRCQGGR